MTKRSSKKPNVVFPTPSTLPLSGPPMSNHWRRIAGFIIAIYLLLTTSVMIKTAVTDDEVTTIYSGYIAWQTGNYGWNREIPHVAKMIATLPLLAMPLNSFTSHPMYLISDERRIGIVFMFDNRVSPKTILWSCRSMMILLSVFFAWGLWRWASQALGPEAAVIALAFWCFNPLVIGNAAIVKPDLPAAGFLLISLWVFWRWFRDLQWKWALASGVCFGAAVGSKYFALLFLPAYVLCACLEQTKGTRRTKSQYVLFAILFIISAWSTVAIFYRFDFSLNDFYNGFVTGQNVMRGATLPGAMDPIFEGRLWLYYGLIFFLKTSTVLLILSTLGAVASFRARAPFTPEQIRRRLDMAWCIVSAVSLFILELVFNRYAGGSRHLLPIYPFLAMMAGYGWMAIRGTAERFWRWGALVWLAADLLAVHPWEIAYFTPFIGGAAQAYRHTALFPNMDLDWGQGLDDVMSKIASRGVSAIYLAYGGSADPSSDAVRAYPLYPYASDWERVVRLQNVDRERLYQSIDLHTQPQAFVVAQADYIFRDPQSELAWLRDLHPAFVSAYAYFVYDITHNPDAQKHLAEFFRRHGDLSRAQEHEDWARQLLVTR